MLFQIPSVVTITLLLSSTAVAASASSCKSFFVEVPVVNATQLVSPIPSPFPKDGYEVAAFTNMRTERNPPPSNPKFQNFSGSFNISVQYCTPSNQGSKASTLQILTHGIGFDRLYWDFRLPSKPNDTQYSYVTSALAAGYSTFSWSRPGNGLSEAPDPYHIIQAPIELSILASLTRMLRSGAIPNVPTPTKVFHVGHSFGSELTNALAALPDANNLTDAVVLTGFSAIFNYTSLSTASSGYHIAATNQPERFGNRSTGFLTWGDKFSNQYQYLLYPYFDPAVLEYSEATKYPVTVGEALTQKYLKFNATNFSGPVLFLPAEADLIFCGSNCYGLFGPGSPALNEFGVDGNGVRSAGKGDVEVYIQKNVGHGINLHYNATGAYNVIQAWAGRKGL